MVGVGLGRWSWFLEIHLQDSTRSAPENPKIRNSNIILSHLTALAVAIQCAVFSQRITAETIKHSFATRRRGGFTLITPIPVPIPIATTKDTTVQVTSCR